MNVANLRISSEQQAEPQLSIPSQREELQSVFPTSTNPCGYLDIKKESTSCGTLSQVWWSILT